MGHDTVERCLKWHNRAQIRLGRAQNGTRGQGPKKGTIGNGYGWEGPKMVQ